MPILGIGSAIIADPEPLSVPKQVEPLEADRDDYSELGSITNGLRNSALRKIRLVPCQ